MPEYEVKIAAEQCLDVFLYLCTTRKAIAFAHSKSLDKETANHSLCTNQSMVSLLKVLASFPKCFRIVSNLCDVL